MRFKLSVISMITVIIIIIFIGISSINEDKEDDHRIFHATLADPTLYVDGLFSEEFILESGNYSLKFVPNGDSPKILSVTINGESHLLEEDFELKSTPYITDTAQYYTWEYLGDSTLENIETQLVQIIINPNGNILGPVSVSLIRE